MDHTGEKCPRWTWLQFANIGGMMVLQRKRFLVLLGSLGCSLFFQLGPMLHLLFLYTFEWKRNRDHFLALIKDLKTKVTLDLVGRTSVNSFGSSATTAGFAGLTTWPVFRLEKMTQFQGNDLSNHGQWLLVVLSTIAVKMDIFRFPRVAWQFQTPIRFQQWNRDYLIMQREAEKALIRMSSLSESRWW